MEMSLPVFNCILILLFFNSTFINFLFRVSFLSFFFFCQHYLCWILQIFIFSFTMCLPIDDFSTPEILFVPKWTIGLEMQTTTNRAVIWLFCRSSFNFWRTSWTWKTHLSWIFAVSSINSWFFHIPRLPSARLVSNPLPASMMYET